MAVLHQSTYSEFKPVFLAAVASKGRRGLSREELLQTVAEFLAKVEYPEQDRHDLAPYVELFVEGVLNGSIDPFPQGGLPPRPWPQVFPEFKANSDLVRDAADQLEDTERALIEQLIAATNLYDSSEAVQELLTFTTKLRAVAPFNAMLLHIQKPRITHAATAHDWWDRFYRVPIVGARPLLVLRIMGPVDFVFDIQDTEGADVPADAFAFPTFGNLTEARFAEFMRAVAKERIDLVELDAGDGSAGWIRLVEKSEAKTGRHLYQLAFNKNHTPAARLVTVAHELAHLFLGHLGKDPGRRVPDNRNTPHELREVEAEMVAFLVAKRNGLTPRSETYLSNYKGAFKDLNLYAVMRAANAVETTLGISAHELWEAKGPPRP